MKMHGEMDRISIFSLKSDKDFCIILYRSLFLWTKYETYRNRKKYKII
jgi:hypothetical protein